MTLSFRFIQRREIVPVLMGAVLAYSSPTLAALLPDSDARQAASLDAREQLRQQARERALQQQNAPESDVRLTRPGEVLPDYPANEKPCFPIQTLRLNGDLAPRFQWALAAADGAKGRCLGGQGIMLALNKVQNAILAAGYVTTRVMA
ncbi:MAG TPA: transporter, partial [Erwinia persicina]|nr:transporter [Erwinia persicina]